MDTPPHTADDILIRTLRRLRRRLTVQQTVRHALHGVWAGATLALIWVVLCRLFPALGDAAMPAAAIWGVSIFVGAAAGFSRRPTLLETALEADRRLELRERITSSLELSAAEGPMVAAVHADARRALDSRDAAERFRFTAPRWMHWAVVPVVLLGLAYVFLPEFDLLNHRERAVEARERAEAVSVNVQRLREAAKPLSGVELPIDGELTDVPGSLERLADDLESGAINQKQALARIGNLAEQLRKHRQTLAESNPDFGSMQNRARLAVTRELANALQEGRLADAAQKAQEIQKQLANASEAERKALAEDLQSLAKSLKETDTALGDALAKAMTDAESALQSGDVSQAQSSVEDMLSELQDQQSVMNQLNQMDTAMQQLQEWQADNLGPSENCRQCGAELSECDAADGQCDATGHKHSGYCQACAAGNGWGQSGGSGSGSGTGTGMGGQGRGEGNRVGELPDVDVGLVPTKAEGDLTRGRMIAEILQRSTPETGEQPTVESLEGAFVEVQQEAEQALVKEEIPPASKEYVRQYFGSLEPEAADADRR